jgi:tetratricopeptide (TPR) repeat protein
MNFVYLGALILIHGLAAECFAAECPAPPLGSQETQTQFQTLDRKAQVEFRHGEFAKAAEDFRQATCLAPENIRSYYELYSIAVAALAANDFDQARKALERADRLRPDYALPLAMLVKVNLLAGDTERVKTWLLDAAQRFPRDGKLHAELAQDLVNLKQYDLALAEALRFEQSGFKDPKVTINLAVLENQAGALGDAVRHAIGIEEEITLPEKVRAPAAAIAGLSYESLGQFPEAVRHLKMAIQLAPDQENAYLALSRIYEKEQNYSAAVETLEQARKQITDSPNLLLALGSNLISAEKYHEAREILAGLIAIHPDELDAYAKLAEAYRNTGEPNQATQTLRRLAARKPDYPMLHVALAESMVAEEPVDYESVLHQLAQAEKASPANYDVHYVRGKVYLAMHNYDLAIAALRRAVQLRPNESAAHYQLGLAYRKASHEVLAKQQFETVEYLKSQSSAIKARD